MNSRYRSMGLLLFTRWESKTHRGHVDIRERPPAEQKEYFAWRHNQH